MMATREAFDRHAMEYREVWSRNPVARLQRDRLWGLVDDRLLTPVRLLDAGCGAGDDVERAVQRGHTVVALDQSAGMLEQVTKHTPEVEVRLGDVRTLSALADQEPFDAALLNFGVLNCVASPVEVAGALADHISPEGWVFAVWMPRFAWGEVVHFASRGQFRTAFRRWPGQASVDVGGESVQTWFHTVKRVREDFDPWFEFERVESLAPLLPPPRQAADRPLDRTWRAYLDERARKFPALRVTGDHVVAAFRRRDLVP
jgi:2-polyprenyl-3-methyl-5-hydroxy-6-metoxy-1,4-benzoquinol methylase